MSAQQPPGMASRGSMSLHRGFTRYSSMLGLQAAFLALTMVASGVNAQIPGTQDLCSCSPTVFNFTFSYGSTCPGNVNLNDGIADSSCLVVAISETDPSDQVPVTIETITILELTMNSVITKTTLQGPFEDGDTVEYASISSYRNLTDTYFPSGLQVISQGLNVAGDTVINTWAIKYTGNCDFEPVFKEDAQIGWIEITGTKGPYPIYCPANDTPTIAPTIGATTIAPTMRATTKAPTDYPIIAPTKAPTDYPIIAPTKAPTDSPIIAPTVAPTEAPTVASTTAPVKDPTEAPTEAPVTEALVADPTEAPTEAPIADPSEAPTEAPIADPTEAPATEAPIADPTEAPVPEAPVADPTEAPVTKAPVAGPTEAPITKAPVTVPTESPATVSPVATPPPATDRPTTPSTSPPVSPPTGPEPTRAPSPTKEPQPPFDMSLLYSDFLNTEFVLREQDWLQ